jgi:transcriptional regulator with XRE-family HTH domain
MSIGQKIKELRKGLGLSQQGLADKIEVDRSNVSAWETDKAEPRWGNIKAMAKLFGVSIQVLLEDEEEQVKPGDPNNVILNAVALLFSEVAVLKAENEGTTPGEALIALKKKGGPILADLDKLLSLP